MKLFAAMLTSICIWFDKLSSSDWILLITFIAIVAYTIETYRLRRWQERSMKLSMLDLRQRILMYQNEASGKGMPFDRNIYNADVINIMNDILEHNHFDFEKLFAPGVIRKKQSLLRGVLNFFHKGK